MSASKNKYIDPLSDFGFKHLFGSEPNKEIMIAFLNALFEGEKHITDIVYNPTELGGDDMEHKRPASICCVPETMESSLS